jgi:hypothetical protein
MISRLNFDIIDTHDFKTLGIIDTSWYNPDITIETPTIEILPPGYTYAVSPFFMVKGLNIYNSNGVGITKASCEEELIDLPDGLWKIKYSICPNDKLFIEKFFLKTDRLMCRYTQAFLNLDLSNCDTPVQKQKKEKLDEIEFYITGAIAASNDQNAKLAHDLYQKANKLLTRYMESNSLHCSC